MPLTIGMRFGSHEITALLGKGGMGEVYRATDTKLNRDVALKFLPEQFTSDPDRLERFQREAHVLASLNHSNIAAIYGFEDSASMRALVMELVEGATLAERIALGSIPIEDVVSQTKQIAEAIRFGSFALMSGSASQNAKASLMDTRLVTFTNKAHVRNADYAPNWRKIPQTAR